MRPLYHGQGYADERSKALEGDLVADPCIMTASPGPNVHGGLVTDDLTPTRIGTSLAGVLAGSTLLWEHPGIGAVAVLSWPRLLLTAVPLLAVLFAVERRLSRRLRAREYSPYPATFPVVLVLFAVSVLLVGAANGWLPSPRRVLHPPVVRLVDVVWHAVTPVGDHLPGERGERDEEGIVVVEDWRAPGTELQLVLPADELDRAHADPAAELEVVEADGFLGVPFVREARFVGR